MGKAPEYRMFLKHFWGQISFISSPFLHLFLMTAMQHKKSVPLWGGQNIFILKVYLFRYSSGLLIARQRSVEMLIMRKASKFIKMFFNGFHTYGKSMMKNWFSKSRSNLFVSTMMTPRKMMSTMASVIRVWWKLDFISGLVIEIVD